MKWHEYRFQGGPYPLHPYTASKKKIHARKQYIYIVINTNICICINKKNCVYMYEKMRVDAFADVYVLRCVAVCCSVLQCVAVRCSVL